MNKLVQFWERVKWEVEQRKAIAKMQRKDKKRQPKEEKK